MSIKTSLEMVREFHSLFKQPDKPIPDLSDEKVNEMRIKLLEEELEELKEAIRTKNTVEVLDALTDLQYVLDGAYISLGYSRYKYFALEEVHKSNLSKLDENGNVIYREDGKILKGKDYFKPNLRKVLDDSNL